MTLKEKLMPPRFDAKNLFGQRYEDTQHIFDAWYDKHITPLFENAVEVSGFSDQDGISMSNVYKSRNDTHKALLIGVEPIKRETAEDLLRELLKLEDRPWYKGDKANEARDLFARARQLVSK